MFVYLDWLLNASSLLSASAELLVIFNLQYNSRNSPFCVHCDSWTDWDVSVLPPTSEACTASSFVIFFYAFYHFHINYVSACLFNHRRVVLFTVYICCKAIWHLLATNVKKHNVAFELEPNVKYSHIEFVLHLDRKPLYYVVNIILPCSLLIIISLLVSILLTYLQTVFFVTFSELKYTPAHQISCNSGDSRQTIWRRPNSWIFEICYIGLKSCVTMLLRSNPNFVLIWQNGQRQFSVWRSFSILKLQNWSKSKTSVYSQNQNAYICWPNFIDMEIWYDMIKLLSKLAHTDLASAFVV